MTTESSANAQPATVTTTTTITTAATTALQARENAADRLHQAHRIIDQMNVTNGEEKRIFDEVRVRLLIDVATEWRYLSERL